ncbi:hypothetical protein [Flavobacterium sp. 5]|uniref:hypothetical protein n=1 Tax=Flavobacterium sp. 5 TaxID=2035199 RepID=UPI000C2C8D39|nr:hypothetical protein [Flavobacterium sp. 5]PKB18291.1 hypothetical protein CLU82_3561 [Flavobacterium sp. 5]
MKTFLDLSFYKKREYIFPNYLNPVIDSNLVGIITHYVELSKSIYGENIFETFQEKDDETLLQNLILRDGVFFEKFYAKHLRFRVNTYFNSYQKTSELILLCNEYYQKDYSESTAIKIIKEDFIKISLNNLKNQTLYQKLKDSVKTFSETKCCEICGNQFKVINFPDWLYFGVNGNISICYECPLNHSSKKHEMIPLIYKFVDDCNFIPNSDFNPINYNFSSRIPKENWTKICKIIFELGIEANNLSSSNKIINKKFGSWFKALIESNVLANGTLKTARGIKCLAKSGNECLSLDEMFIDNWFFENNIKTEKEPYYPTHPIYNKSGKRRADWKINDYYIEYFGLKGEETYDLKTKEKIELSKAMNLKLISLYPSDLNNLNEKFIEIKATADSYTRFGF